jgi:hypothetical protein
MHARRHCEYLSLPFPQPPHVASYPHDPAEQTDREHKKKKSELRAFAVDSFAAHLETPSSGCVRVCEGGAQVWQVADLCTSAFQNISELPEEDPEERKQALGNEQHDYHSVAPSVHLKDAWPLYPRPN